MIILKKCLGFFQGDMIEYHDFAFVSKQTFWFKQVQIGHRIKFFLEYKQFRGIYQIVESSKVFRVS